MGKIKGTLLMKKQVADIVCLAVLHFKEEFKNLDLDQVKNDFHYILYLISI